MIKKVIICRPTSYISNSIFDVFLAVSQPSVDRFENMINIMTVTETKLCARYL